MSAEKIKWKRTAESGVLAYRDPYGHRWEIQRQWDRTWRVRRGGSYYRNYDKLAEARAAVQKYYDELDNNNNNEGET